MNYLDIVFLIILGISFFSGLKRGLVGSAFSLLGIILGIWLAGRYYASFSSSTAGQVVAFIILFILVALAVSIIGRVVSKIVHLVLLGWLDALLGGVLALFMAGTVIALALVAYTRFIGPADIISGSFIARTLIDKLPLVLGLLPDRFRQGVAPYFR